MRIIGENSPLSDACVTTTLTLNNVITNKISPITSNFLTSEPVVSAFVSGVCLIKKNATNDSAIEIINIQCHPIVDATQPPNKEQIPLPPHDPIDQ